MKIKFLFLLAIALPLGASQIDSSLQSQAKSLIGEISQGNTTIINLCSKHDAQVLLEPYYKPFISGIALSQNLADKIKNQQACSYDLENLQAFRDLQKTILEFLPRKIENLEVAALEEQIHSEPFSEEEIAAMKAIADRRAALNDALANPCYVPAKDSDLHEDDLVE